MLNEWSDRVPPHPKRPRWRRPELWLGLLVVLGAVAVAADLIARLLG